MIKFNKYNVTNTETKEKRRVWYSIGNRIDDREAVTVYAKDYSGSLSFLQNTVDVKNDTDTMTDYFEKDRVVFFKDHPLYAKALEAALRSQVR